MTNTSTNTSTKTVTITLTEEEWDILRNTPIRSQFMYMFRVYMEKYYKNEPLRTTKEFDRVKFLARSTFPALERVDAILQKIKEQVDVFVDR